MNEKLQRIRNGFKGGLKQNIKELFWIGLVFITVNFLLFQPFKIPSGSMIPTLLVGDFLVVNKYCYGYSNSSFRIGTFTFPFPRIHGRMFSSRLPKRGEVVVFRNERDKDQNYIKRIIGLPGDKIQLIGGIVHINDKPVEIREVGEYSLVEEKEFTVFKKYIEKLPEGYEHVIIKAVHFGQGVFDNVGPFNVPEGHYFMMGDNRDHSQDSRSTEAVGCIALENILGKAEAIFFSSSCSLFEVLKWPFSMRFERFCTPIR